MNGKLLHRHGGKIVSVTAIAHETYKGVADWFYIGDVQWSDGSSSTAIHISPYNLCYDDNPESKTRLLDLHAKLSNYLERTGQWHEPKYCRDGRVYSWTPYTKEGCETL